MRVSVAFQFRESFMVTANHREVNLKAFIARTGSGITSTAERGVAGTGTTPDFQ